MVDTTREIVHDRRSGSGVAWFALFIAILALIVAWLAYNRSGEDLESRIQSQIEQSVQEIDQRTPDVDVDIQEPSQEQQNGTETTPETNTETNLETAPQ